MECFTREVILTKLSYYTPPLLAQYLEPDELVPGADCQLPRIRVSWGKCAATEAHRRRSWSISWHVTGRWVLERLLASRSPDRAGAGSATFCRKRPTVRRNSSAADGSEVERFHYGSSPSPGSWCAAFASRTTGVPHSSPASLRAIPDAGTVCWRPV